MSSRPPRFFTREFKLAICRSLADGSVRIVTVCREQSQTRSVRDELRRAQGRIEALEAALGRAHLEAELLQRALAAGEAKHGYGPGGSRLGSAARCAASARSRRAWCCRSPGPANCWPSAATPTIPNCDLRRAARLARRWPCATSSSALCWTTPGA
jgi:hypothetical protein